MTRSDYFSLLSNRGLLLVVLGVAWTVGILIDDILQVSPQLCLLFSGLFLLLLVIFWRDQRDRLLLLLFLCLSLGAWRCSLAQSEYDSQSLKRYIASKLTVRGTVSDEPKLEARTRLLTISVNAVQNTSNSQWENADGVIEVSTLFQGASAEDRYGANYGDSVEVSGKLQPPTPTSAKNVVASMAFPRIFVSATGGNVLIASIYHVRNQLATFIEQALPEPEAAILIAVFLGLHTPALNILVSTFNVTGTAHLIASSGFKVTILSGLVARPTQALLRKYAGPSSLMPLHKRWRDWIRTILQLLGVALYTVLSGAGPAALRAGIMGGLLVIAPRLGRNYNVYTSLAVAAILMSCIDPFVLWDVGFQLSFLGTLGIVLLTPYIQKLLQPIAILPAGSLIIDLAAVTLAAQVATWPIVAIAFHNISLIAPITNILTVPLLGPLILLGLVIGVTGLILHPLSLLCGWMAWPLLWYVQAVITQCAILQDSFIYIGNFDTSIAWMYYGVLTPAIGFLLYRYPVSPTKHHASLLTPRKRVLLYVGGVVLILVVTGFNVVSSSPPAGNTVSFFDIDAIKANGAHVYGEAIFVRTQDGKTLLIDGGGDSTSLSQLLDGQLPPWRRSLDMVILTSPQQDTMTGLQDVLTRYDVGSVFDAGMAHPTTNYARWRQTIKERNLPYAPVTQGTTIALGSTVQLQVLWPQGQLHTTGSDEVRDNALVLRLVMPGMRLLLLGSSIQSNYALSGLLTSVDENLLKADIVQVLGDMTTPVPSVLTDVLQQAQPSLLVVTATTQRKQGQATSANTHATLSSALVSIPQVLETAQVGTVELHCDGNGWAL